MFLEVLSLSLRVPFSLSSQGHRWIVGVLNFQNMYSNVGEVSEVNIWTVFAVGICLAVGNCLVTAYVDILELHFQKKTIYMGIWECL